MKIKNSIWVLLLGSSATTREERNGSSVGSCSSEVGGGDGAAMGIGVTGVGAVRLK